MKFTKFIHIDGLGQNNIIFTLLQLFYKKTLSFLNWLNIFERFRLSLTFLISTILLYIIFDVYITA